MLRALGFSSEGCKFNLVGESQHNTVISTAVNCDARIELGTNNYLLNTNTRLKQPTAPMAKGIRVTIASFLAITFYYAIYARTK